MRIARYRRAALGQDGGPDARFEVEHVRVGQVARSVVAAEQHHGVAVDDGRGAVARARTPPGGGDGTPGPRREVEPVKVGAVAAVVPAVDVRAVLMHHGRMRMARTGRTAAQCRHLSPRHAAEIEPVKVGHPARAVETAKDEELGTVDQRDVPIAGTGRRTAAGAGQHGTPPPLGEAVGVKIVQARLTVVPAEDAEGAADGRGGVEGARARRDAAVGAALDGDGRPALLGYFGRRGGGGVCACGIAHCVGVVVVIGSEPIAQALVHLASGGSSTAADRIVPPVQCLTATTSSITRCRCRC